MTPQEKFEKATALLTDLGVPYIAKEEYNPPGQLPILTAVTLPFTAEEWCSIASSDGDQYIGGCCTQTSLAQDIICDIFRQDMERTPIKRLENLADIMCGHDGILEFPEVSFAGIDIPVEEAVSQIQSGKIAFSEMWTLSKIALIWYIVKDVYDVEMPKSNRLEKSNSVDNAVWELGQQLFNISISDMFEKLGPVSQQNALKILRLYKLLPALKILNEKIDELYPGPMDGFAIWSNETNNFVENGNGPCIFNTKEECESLLDLLENRSVIEEKENIRNKLYIRPVSVSKEKGIEPK